MQEDDGYLGGMGADDALPRRRQSDAAHMADFARFGSLDAYDLTDDELAQMLELWRWTVWKAAHQPSAVDHDILQAVQAFQRQLAEKHDLDMEYNTALLLKQELEPLMHFRALRMFPAAMWYFVRRLNPLVFLRAWHRARRYDALEASRGQRPSDRGYPRELLESFRGRPPNMLKRKYWRSLTAHSYDERKQMKRWW
ncbi:MAG: hypothetical protein KME04_15830 [Pleurocapsa minor GSE-CHR-MK-17-07R]|jgi:hypothetical protein|nr:hypothetical protein [Pleurocapsa minor GSE-CHR-MK 17-07R]